MEDLPLHDPDLSTRAKNALARLGVHTSRQIGSLDLEKLSLTKGAGLKTIREILTLRELVLGERTENDKGYIDHRGSYRPNREKSWYPPMIQRNARQPATP